MIPRPEELFLTLEYFDGKEVYRVRTTFQPYVLFDEPEHDNRRAAGYAAENMWHKLKKDLFDRA